MNKKSLIFSIIIAILGISFLIVTSNYSKKFTEQQEQIKDIRFQLELVRTHDIQFLNKCIDDLVKMDNDIRSQIEDQAYIDNQMGQVLVVMNERNNQTLKILEKLIDKVKEIDMRFGPEATKANPKDDKNE